ncbi:MULTISPECIES: ORC1-type DNA replication protein [Methanohalophilus]|jgi:cell division control protein 6|uniref:ORC1-type DNA replication protein n=1 Tax=Methanohalophilus euhalobius TaxID=51203 RepID=A0A315B861_9EURY|nr:MULTISPECIES: ORC1-type DNA replication protein [Methanohalophilus]PQV42303.1 ORC complex protein Cdc6/Orc1 [Methanohalophilus euhalobius]RNI07816.1 ORC1-type DNA replication protein [Methanohalophilus euhalobius]RSD34448.1 MAG: archaeal cell division control protein 6 [Methanohalophilus sp.]RXG34475.1 archaeal cell division control protein 6 [Methanohalophilus sp. WG1-DM]
MDNGSLDGLFEELLETESLFKNKEVLRPAYTPENLPHRSNQINNIATVLVSALKGHTPSNILIYGKTGTGKTAVARYVGIELERKSDHLNVQCNVLYINCEVIDTQYRLLANLAKQFGEDVPMTGWPTDQVFFRFKEAVDTRKQVIIIILDEIDKLIKKGDDVLYNLSRMNTDLKNARVSMIGISNDLKFTEFLDPRVKSSLGEEEIIFPPYDAEQISDILRQRAAIAYKENSMDDMVIPLCSAFAAQEHGDARRALDLMRVAGEIAEREKKNIIEEEHVRQAQEKIEVDRIVEVIRTLPTQSKLALYSVMLLRNNGHRNVTTGEVYNVYRQLCRNVDTDILTQRRVTDLISELDMLGILNAIVVSKGRYGRTKEIILSVPVESTKKVLLEDYRLNMLADFKPVLTAQMHL